MKKQPEHNRKNVPPQDTAKAPKSAVSRSMRTRAIVLAALIFLILLLLRRRRDKDEDENKNNGGKHDNNA